MQHPRRAWGMVAMLTATAVLLSALNAAAATFTYDPTAVTQTGWTLTGTGTAATLLGDVDDATYLSGTTSNSPVYVSLSDPSGNPGVITNVTVYARVAETGAGTPTVRLGVGAADAIIAGGWAAAAQSVTSGVTMMQIQDSWAADPRGGAWTWDDIASLQAVFQKESGTNTIRVAKIWIVVTFDPETVPPTVSSASATDAAHVEVVFSEPIDPASVSTSDFGIPGLTVGGVSVSGSTVTLTTSVQNSISYTVSCAAGAVSDLVGNGNTGGSATFTGIDGIAPALVSASSTDATHVQVVFSEPIASGSVTASDFSIPGLTVAGTYVSGSTVTLTTSVQDGIGYTVTCAAGNVSDIAGNGNGAGSRSFTGTDGIAPTLVSATPVDATHVSLVFSESLAAATVTDTDFAIAGLTITGASASGATVTLTTTTQDGISYTVDCAAGRVTDVAGNGNAAGSRSFSGIDGVKPRVVAAGSSSPTGVDVTFSEALASASISGSDFQIPGLTVTGAVLDADGLTVHLTTSIQDGISYTVGCLADVVSDLAANGNASGSAEFTGTDGIKPELVSAAPTDETHLDVVFSEPLQSGSVGASDFSVPGLTVSAAMLDADGHTVHLTTTVQAGGVSYTLACAAGRVLDIAGNGNVAGSQAFLGYDDTPPTMLSASVTNTTHVEVVFSETLQPGSIQAADFTIANLTVLGAVLDADGVTVHLTTSGQTGGKNYTLACATGQVLDLSGLGNAAGATTFTGSSIVDDQPPTDPGSVVAVAGGVSPTIASLSWTASTDNIAVAGYRVYRSTSASGPFSAIGTTTALTYADVTGVPGQDYWYAVAAYDAVGNESARVAATGVPVVATWTIEPHDAYTADTRLCKLCHQPHTASTADNIFRPAGDQPGEMSVCYACHDGSGASDNIKTGATNSFTAGSGHTLESVTPGTDLTNQCSSCHGPHRDYTTSPMLPKSSINGVSVTQADNSWCLACHNATNSWYAGTYPTPSDPSRDDTGYPVAGTFPGPATYNSATANAHSAIPATAATNREAGDCLYCHSSHRGKSTYDGLVGEFKPPVETSPASAAYDDYAEACFVCHGSVNTYGFATPPTNIQQFVTAGGERSGHRIETAGGLYPVGTPLPCYECHNPHGSTRGNQTLFSDELGQDLKVSGANAAEAALNVREFCFTCHTTGDAAPKAWDSTANGGAGAYVAVTNTDTIAGLYRDGHTATAAVNRLRIPAVTGHYAADTQSCGSCHGSDYETGGLNTHNPSGGASEGGIACYSCHNYQANMEDLAGSKAGDPALLDDSAHHVMGGAGVEGDIAPKGSPTGYPTSQNDVYCVSCHTDHNYFNADKGANLRTDLSGTSGASTANTDFIAGNPSGGICLSCHTAVKSKQNMGTEQLNAGAATTPAIDRAAYDASAHDYTVASSFGTSGFGANCSKCHTDEQAKEYSSVSGYRFGTHWSAKAGILGALGASLPVLPKAEACLKCHNDTAQPYGAVIAAPANTTADEFAMASTHDLTRVTCVNCHNVHEASAANPAADPVNTYNVAPLGTSAQRVAYCLKCHSGASLAQTVTATALVPYAVTPPASVNVGSTYTTSGHGAGLPTSATANSTTYAATATDVTNDWTNDNLSVGSGTGDVASSPADNAFEMRHGFGAIDTSTWTGISSAAVTVRSAALGAWGQSGTLPGTPYTNVFRPTGDGDRTGTWIYSAGTAGWSLVDEADPANTLDRITSPVATTSRYLFTSTAPALPANAMNINVSVSFNQRDDATGGGAGDNSIVGQLKIGTSYYSSPEGSVDGNNTAYTTYTHDFPVNPATGIAWTPAQVNGIAQFGVYLPDSNPDIRVAQVYMTVTYNTPGTAYSNDDTWQIQYTTAATPAETDWVDITARSSAAEAMTDHAFTIPAGALTTANISNFKVRIIGRVVGGADNAGTVEWDRSALGVDYTYNTALPGPGIDCRACHEQHGSSLVHLLSATAGGEAVSEYADLRDQAQCLACHDSDGPAASANIARYYPTTAYGEATQSGTLPTGTRFGHRIKTGAYADQAMPCRSCHNPHGGASGGFMLAVRTNINGVDTILGDQAGELAMSATDQETDSNVRNFCFACHTTSDTTAGWNGSSMTAVTSGQVMGVDRIGGVLKLPAKKGHASTDAESCYVCHGDDFSESLSVNVHNPARGESPGGIPCYECHTVYRTMMEDEGALRSQQYHHVLGNGATHGDRAFSTGTYPNAAGTDVYCLSCHVDHDKFINTRGFNLRNRLANEAASDTDFDPTANVGICTDCHGVARTKDATNRKNDGSTQTLAVVPGTFGVSIHDYVATSTFTGASATFRANCSKCHDSEIDGGGMEAGIKTSGFQTSVNKFSTHYSANRRILGAMGVPVGDPPGEEDVCYACHITAAGSAADKKTVTLRDAYNAATMSAVSETTYGLTALETYRHDVTAYDGLHRTSPTDETRAYLSANKHVECEDCHSVHAATATRHTAGIAAGNAVSGVLKDVPGAGVTFSGTNWTAPTAYTTVAAATYEYQICFRCHSGYNTNLTSWGGTGSQSWTDQGLEFSPANRSGHPIAATLNNSPGRLAPKALNVAEMRAPWTTNVGNQTMYCSDCHASSAAGSMGPHGSSVKWMLAGTAKAWPYNSAALNGSNGTTNLQTLAGWTTTYTANSIFCSNCHLKTNDDFHARSDHSGVACVECHIRVPHGGKVSRLQAPTGVTNAYPGNLPARYTANGEGARPNGSSWVFESFWKQTYNNYDKDSCEGNTGSSGGRTCDDHNGRTQTTPERW